MAIDYAGLYARSYFGHTPGATSFRREFPGILASCVRDLQCGGVLDVGSGSGELARTLAAQSGLPAVSADFREDIAAGVLQFDLTTHDPVRLASLRAQAGLALSGEPHLTTCLDVLEHIDRKDIAFAVYNLRELTRDWLLVSVSTRPSSENNLYHATVIPRRTWRRIFEAAGLTVRPYSGADAMAYHLEYPDAPSFWGMNQWRRIDPFLDSTGPEPYYLLLQKSHNGIALETTRARIHEILGVSGATEYPDIHPETHLTFLIGHYQDFHHYLPFWEKLDRRSVRILIRGGALQWIDAKRYAAILSYLRCRGLEYKAVQSVHEVDWSRSPGSRRAFVVATESTVVDTHLVNAAFVLAAAKAGYRTFQIQHGIWPHQDFQPPVAFASRTILTWSDEFAQGFAHHFSSGDASRTPPGTIGRPRFVKTGCPKFDSPLPLQRTTPADLLGDWAESYAESVLVGTNLHWHQNVRGAEVLPALIRVAERRPSTLFLCKLHPVHDIDDRVLQSLPPNLRVLDEFACLFAELTTPRLLRACDAVVSTHSTIALEAALAAKPLVVIDTGNPNQFAGVDPAPLESLETEVSELLDERTRSAAIAKHTAFRDHYFDQALFGRGLELVLKAIDADFGAIGADPAMPLTPASVVAESFAASLTTHYTKQGREQIAGLAAGRAEIESELETLRRQLHEAEARHGQELTLARAECQARDLEVDTLSRRLQAAEARIAEVGHLGTGAVMIADGVERMSRRYPRAASTLGLVWRRLRGQGQT